MKIKVLTSVLALVISVDCQGLNPHEIDAIRFAGERFQMGPVPYYQPYQVPIRGDVNNLQLQGGPTDIVKEEMQAIKPPNRNLEPPYYSGEQATLSNKNSAVTIDNRIGNTSDSSANTEQLDVTTGALSHFGFKLIQDFSKAKTGNTVVSSYSVAVLLSLLQQGASGSSLQQITQALVWNPQESADIFQKLSNEIKKRDSHNVLEVANNIFVSNNFDLNKNFKSVASNKFKSDVTPLNFDGTLAAQTINKWVAKKTRNKINNLVSPDAVGENTQLILLNAIYFKGLWKMKFNKNTTTPGKFNLRNGQKKVTPYMRSYHMYKSGYDPRIKADIIILPFENDEYSMMILLPTGIDEMEYTLSELLKVNLKEYHEKLTFQEVKLEIPKFSIKEQVDLIPVLKKMGITDVFTGKSNLSGIGIYRDTAPRIDNALHSAVLSIDEDGGTAAGATAFTVIALMYEDTPEIKVNKPFIAVIWDNKLSIPLFIARVEDPTL